MRTIYFSLLPLSAFALTEYVGMAPVNLCCGATNVTIKWAKLEYEGATSVDDVSFTMVDAGMKSDVEALGAWFDFEVPHGVEEQDGYGAVLTARVHDDKLYIPAETSWFADRKLTTGCCADKMHVHDRSTGQRVVHEVSAILDVAMPGVATKGNSHTFDVFEDDTATWVVLDVQYLNYTLNEAGAKADGVVVYNAETSELLTTADGEGWFDIAGPPATLATDSDSTIYKIQHGTWDSSGDSGAAFEQWHQNGVLRFKSNDGTSLMAITHFAHHEAVIMLDPYVYPAEEGGGEIVQRFGTPGIYNETGGVIGYHHFGVDEGTLIPMAVHNVYYSPSSETSELKGQETLTLYVNQLYYTDARDGILHPEDRYSFVAEFAIRPKRQKDVEGAIDDSVFATDYVMAQLDFIATQQGGARMIGDGVYISSTGVSSDVTQQDGRINGMQIVDLEGGHKSLSYGHPNSFYDSFVRVVVDDAQ